MAASQELHPRPHGRNIAPEAFLGGPIAAVHEGDTITFDIPARKLTLNVPAEEIAARLKSFAPPAPRFTRGVFAKYANSVSSASQGAITELGIILRPFKQPARKSLQEPENRDSRHTKRQRRDNIPA